MTTEDLIEHLRGDEGIVAEPDTNLDYDRQAADRLDEQEEQLQTYERAIRALRSRLQRAANALNVSLTYYCPKCKTQVTQDPCQHCGSECAPF